MTESDSAIELAPIQVVERLRSGPGKDDLRVLVNQFVAHRRLYTLAQLIEIFQRVPADHRTGDESLFFAVASDIAECGPAGSQFLFDTYTAGTDELRAGAILGVLTDTTPDPEPLTAILYDALNDDRPAVVAEAIGCLRHRGDTSVIERVQAYGYHADPRVRGAVIDYAIALDLAAASELIENAVSEMREAARRLHDLVENAASISIYSLLAGLRDVLPRLYVAGTRLPHVLPISCRDETVNLTDAERDAVRMRLRERLTGDTRYWEIFDPFEGLLSGGSSTDSPPEPVWWELWDRIASVYDDVWLGLRLLDAGHPVQALWTWRFWSSLGLGGEETLSALRAIHHLLADDHIVPDVR